MTPGPLPFLSWASTPLTAVGLRSRLQEATGLALPTALVFGHPLASPASPPTLRPLLISRRAPPTRAATGPAACCTLYERSVRDGRFDSYLDLLGDLAGHRDRFEGGGDCFDPLGLVDLAAGPGELRLICCAGTAPWRDRTSSAGSPPPSRTGCRCPRCRSPATSRASSCPRVAGGGLGALEPTPSLKSTDGPFVVSHSAGALVAYAGRRTHRPRPPAAGVTSLIGVLPARTAAGGHRLAHRTATTMFGREGCRSTTPGSPPGRLPPLHPYWQPRDLAVPTLLVPRHQASAPGGSQSWRSHLAVPARQHMDVLEQPLLDGAGARRGRRRPHPHMDRTWHDERPPTAAGSVQPAPDDPRLQYWSPA